jgi:hypothetical protein
LTARTSFGYEAFEMNYGAVEINIPMNRFFAIHVLSLVALIQAFTGVEPARATNIQIDLGPPPVVSHGVTVPFADLNGTSLSGQNLSLDFLFSGAQFVRLFSVTSDFEVSVKLQTNSVGLVGFVDGTGFLSDQFGNPLQPPQVLGSASSSDGSMLAGLFPLFAGGGAPSQPFDFFAVHFDLSLPNNSSFEITGSEFELLSVAGGPFGVGPGVPNDIVPDTADSIYLLGIGLVGLLVAHLKFNWAA